MRLKTVVTNVTVIAVSTLVAVGAAEAVLRAFPQLLPEEIALRTHWSALAKANSASSIADPYIGFLYPPHRQRQLSNRDVSFSYVTDELGFRNASPLPATADIVVLGDSQVFSFGVKDHEAWPRLLEESLDEKRVVNLGLIGAGPRQYLRIYETFGRSFEPELVLFCIFTGNDVPDAVSFDRWLAAGATGNYDVWRFFGEDGPPTSPTLRQSYLRAFVGHTVRHMRERSSSRTLELDGGGRLQVVPSLIAHSSSGTALGDPRFERVMEIVEQAYDAVRGDGAEMLVVLIPTKEEVYLPLLGEHTPEPATVFAEGLRQRRLPFLDLTPYLQQRAEQGEQLYFEIDGHTNAAGYSAIAEGVRAHLEMRAQTFSLLDREAHARER